MTAAPDPTNPQLWMQRAHSNLRLAKIGQMKGVVLVQSRYPGWVEEVTLEEYCEALLLAQQVVTWADSLLLGRKV